MTALVLFLGVTGQAKADYLFATLDPVGSIRTEAQGINPNGDIVGLYEDAKHNDHGFLLIGGAYEIFHVPVLGTTSTQRSGLNDFAEILRRCIRHGSHHR